MEADVTATGTVEESGAADAKCSGIYIYGGICHMAVMLYLIKKDMHPKNIEIF